MKTKRVTIKDIAELAGVSKATASLVLNGRGKELRVAQDTRERVLAIAREQHYQPSIHARCAITAATPSVWWCLKSPTTDLPSSLMSWKCSAARRAFNC